MHICRIIMHNHSDVNSSAFESAELLLRPLIIKVTTVSVIEFAGEIVYDVTMCWETFQTVSTKTVHQRHSGYCHGKKGR